MKAVEAVLSRVVVAQIEGIVEAAYPAEGCGIVTEEASTGGVRVVGSPNLADVVRRADPEGRLRPGLDRGYVLDGRLILAAERRGEVLRVIFHSHPEGGAYFSEEDSARALVDWGDGLEPAFPGVDYLVTAVEKGRAVGSVLFRYEVDNGAYVPMLSFGRCGSGE